jgi:PKD repeat protein
VVCVAVVGVVVAACAPTPPQPPDAPPRAAITAEPTAGTAPLAVHFSAAGSVDPDGDVLSYAWDFGEGAGPEVGGIETQHVYEAPGSFTATLTVTGGGGRSASATVQVEASPRPPATLASAEPIDVRPEGDPIAVFDTGPWDMWEIREPGAPIYDGVTGSWICTYTGRGNMVEGNAAVTASIGAVVSEDGQTWRPHPQNPLTGAAAVGGVGQGEDPYIAKDAETGEVWRDSAGRALMFTEEKDFDVHRGVGLWRSAPNTLSDWTLAGQAIDRGAAGAWDATDRTSPLVIHHEGRLVLLFEGRNMAAGQEGQIGIAVSTDEGATWQVRPDPIVGRGGPGTWNENSIVPDDLIRVGDDWVLLAHGQRVVDGLWTAGRYVTSVDPAAWTAGSFAELPGNPVTPGSDTVMAWGNDPTRAMDVTGDGHRLQPVVVTRRAGG